MTELLPCPFCGGEAEILTAESMRGGYLFDIMCNDCCSRGDVYETEAEAIAAWNTRAERTCNIIGFDDGVDEGIDGEWHQYSEPQYDLSCGHSSQGVEPPNYCPNCGARVKN